VPKFEDWKFEDLEIVDHPLFNGEAATLITYIFWKFEEFEKQRIGNCRNL
jgi:hypothetical protein